MVNVDGSTALVTGGQRGLGKAIVDELLRRGAAKVYATARDPKPSAEKILDAIANGDNEILVDDLSRQVKAALSGPAEGLRQR